MTLDASSPEVANPAAAARATGRRRGTRSTAASIGLHAALTTASLVAVFPVFWVLVTS